MGLSEIDRLLLGAMAQVHRNNDSRKSDVILRMALREAGSWNDRLESSLSNAGNEDTLVADFYGALRRLVRETPLADGAGDLELPAGPRYTECWITQAGLNEIERLDAQSEP